MHTCPICQQPVDTSTQAHVVGADGRVYHPDCYTAEADQPANPPAPAPAQGG
jgi:hypothetical protein